MQIKVCKNLPLKFPPKMAANPKETTAIIRENAADHALRPLFMRFEWTRCASWFKKGKKQSSGNTEYTKLIFFHYDFVRPVNADRLLYMYMTLCSKFYDWK